MTDIAESKEPNQPKRGSWGGRRPGAGRKAKRVAVRLGLVRELNRLDVDEQQTLGPLLEAERDAHLVAADRLTEWEAARVLAEIKTELRCSAAREYLERRAALLEQLHQLGPVRPDARKN